MSRVLVATVIVIGVVSGSGCLTLNPANQTRANGAPLVVDDRGRNFQLRQGQARIDEQDFYDIAGDRAAAEEVRAVRFDLVITQIVGQAAGAGGIGGVLLGGGTLAGGIVWTAQDGPIGLLLLLPGALLLTGSIVAIPVGYASAANASDELYDYVLPKERAEAAARRHNSGKRSKRR